MRKVIAITAAAAALQVFAGIGLARSAPVVVNRRDVDLSDPYIPPAQVKPTREQIASVNTRMAKAKEKRARKAARNMALVACGGHGMAKAMSITPLAKHPREKIADVEPATE